MKSQKAKTNVLVKNHWFHARSQVTVFIIIGLVVLLLAGTAYLYFGQGLSGLKNENIKQLPQDFLDKTIEQCIHDNLIDTIDKYGLCSTEKRIKESLMTGLAACIDLSKFKDEGYTVTSKGKPDSVDAEIKPNSVDVVLVYPIELVKGTERLVFSKKEYSLSRSQSINIDLDFSGKTKKDYVLVSPDLNAELAVFKGTKISTPGKKVDNISVYMKELCPDDPSVVGKVKYVYSPDNILFSPEAFITIRYANDFVSRLASEDKFKVAYLKGESWEQIASSDNIEKNKVRTSTSHLSEWIASCDATNKYGIQLMDQEAFATSPGSVPGIITRDLKCAYNFSGPCGYAKLTMYMKVDNFLPLYEDAINKIYAQHLIPIITVKELPPKQNFESIWYFKHLGLCEKDLDCKYGENEDGSGKPGYDYNQDIALLVSLYKVHKDKQEWPIYLELWEEPNLASEWGDISVTDYQIEMYGKYFKKLGEAVKALPHSESIKIMPAGLAPTDGMKRCMLTPKFDKQYDASPDSAPIEESKSPKGAYLAVGDCQKLKYMPDYIDGTVNHCEPDSSLPPPQEEKDCNTITKPCTNGQSGQCPDDSAIQACCDSQKNYIKGVLAWKKYYMAPMGNLFSDPLYDDPAEACTVKDVKQANQIVERIHNTVGTYCFEKITEVPTSEYLNKLYKGQFGEDLCKNMDLYADHSYPNEDTLASYPGGNNPFGMTAYKDRFSMVASFCEDVGNLKCTDVNNLDTDADGLKNINDNCPYVANQEQKDWDNDGYGDVCDDSDKDGSLDSVDKCPLDSAVQTGDDTDNDGWANTCDNCQNLANPDQKDLDLDTLGDSCDDNTDNDGVPDTGFAQECAVNKDNAITTNCIDNCRYIPNGQTIGTCLGENKICNSNSECSVGVCQKNQEDEDNDGMGDVCDNCVNYPNPDQADWNKNGVGNVCEDSDGDGFNDNVDFCPNTKTTENKPELCQATQLCVGKTLITETAWAPHVDIYPDNLKESVNFNVDDYASQMSQAFDAWAGDNNVLAAIPFHLGENPSNIRKGLENYSWTEKICTDACVGKKIYNLVGKVQTPVTQCIGDSPIPGGSCVNSKLIYQNLKAQVGAKTNQYSCMRCNEDGTLNAPGSSETIVNMANGLITKFKGMDECFEVKELEIPAGAGGCPEVVGSDTNDGYMPYEMTIGGQKYYGWAVCVPDAALTSSKAWFHACGTEAECNYNKDNCLESGFTDGTYFATCKIKPDDKKCTDDIGCKDASKPKCQPEKKQCVECLASADCKDTTKPVCDTTKNSCVAGCLASADCKDTLKPVCDVPNKLCFECLANTDCKNTTKPVCDASGNKICVECLANTDCKDIAKPVCNTQLRTCTQTP